MSAPKTRRPGRSAAAILAGFVVVFALSLGTDQLFHWLGVYPPWNQPMRDAGPNALALAYRLVYNTFGGYLMARLAPYAPMTHALAGGAIGLALSTAGACAAVRLDLGPAWYPIALALSALPTAWLGGALWVREQAGGSSPLQG